MHIIQGKLTKPKQKDTAQPLADPDALVPGIPNHVQRPNPNPLNPVSVSAKRRIKAIKRRLGSHKV